jgi:hypothetical protein
MTWKGQEPGFKLGYRHVACFFSAEKYGFASFELPYGRIGNPFPPFPCVPLVPTISSRAPPVPRDQTRNPRGCGGSSAWFGVVQVSIKWPSTIPTPPASTPDRVHLRGTSVSHTLRHWLPVSQAVAKLNPSNPDVLSKLIPWDGRACFQAVEFPAHFECEHGLFLGPSHCHKCPVARINSRYPDCLHYQCSKKPIALTPSWEVGSHKPQVLQSLRSSGRWAGHTTTR